MCKRNACITHEEAEKRLLTQAFNRVQFGSEGWDSLANEFLRLGQGVILPPDETFSEIGPLTSFYATPEQRANANIYVEEYRKQIGAYRKAGIIQPSLEQILQDAKKHGEYSEQMAENLVRGSLLIGGLVLAPVAAGSPIAAEVVVFSKNPVGYCLANPVGCAVTVEEAAYTVSGAVSVNSVVPDIPTSGLSNLNVSSSLIHQNDLALFNKHYPGIKVSTSRARLPGQVNQDLALSGYRSPYAKDAIVVEAVLAVDTQFVRVFTKGKSEPAGKWIMKAEDIQGLTPKQIQQKYALPSLPTHRSNAKIGSGIRIRAGKVGPNFGFGGGNTQYELLDRVENAFTNIKPLK
jgi:hypothetical protein